MKYFFDKKKKFVKDLNNHLEHAGFVVHELSERISGTV